MRHRLLAVLATTLAGLCLVAADAAAIAPLPVLYDGLVGYAHVSSTASPPGANNWSCKPSAANPRPVILVHGTFADMSNSWQALSPLLYDNGYCVFAFNYGSVSGSGTYGIYAVGEIANSAKELSGFVNRVLAATGASQVDLVGHSQGGMMPRYYLKFLHGDATVHTLVGLAPSNHGTTLAGFFPGAKTFIGALCDACAEQEVDSVFLTGLNAAGDTVPGVDYTVIGTSYDQVVTPYTSAFLSGPNVQNILVQEQCILDRGEHLSMPYDHIALADVLNALDPAHPVHPACTPVLPIAGG